MKKKTVLLISLVMFIVAEIIILYNFKDRNFANDNDINIDKNSSLVKELYDMVNPSNNAILLDELYKNKDLTSKYIVAMGINNYLKYNEIKKFNNNELPLSKIQQEIINIIIEQPNITQSDIVTIYFQILL